MNRKAAGLLVVAVALALSVTAEEHEIGSWGATVELSPRWERRVISPDLGPDQFYNTGIDVFTAIIELDALLGCREDLEDHLDQFISGIELVHRELEKDDRTWYEERGEVARATRRMIAHKGGIRLAYQIDVVGRHGLGYMVLSWGSPTETVDVYDWASRVARSIQFPGPHSEWGRRSTPAVHTFRFGG